VTFSQPVDDTRRRHPSVVVEPPEVFAHPSERLFAKLLSLYGYEWRYEPIEFPLDWDDGGTPRRGFRPDFYLPAERLFIELTVLDQRLVTRKNQKIRRFRALYPEVSLQVVYQRDFVRLVRRHELDPRNDHAA
jgi:hypothetical protein